MFICLTVYLQMFLWQQQPSPLPPSYSFMRHNELSIPFSLLLQRIPYYTLHSLIEKERNRGERVSLQLIHSSGAFLRGGGPGIEGGGSSEFEALYNKGCCLFLTCSYKMPQKKGGGEVIRLLYSSKTPKEGGGIIQQGCSNKKPRKGSNNDAPIQ